MLKKVKSYKEKIKTTGFCAISTKKDIEALKKAMNYKTPFQLRSIIFQNQSKNML